MATNSKGVTVRNNPGTQGKLHYKSATARGLTLSV